MTTPPPSNKDPHLGGHLTNDDVSVSGYQTLSASDERDEINEVRKLARKDTKQVHLWRLAATFALLLTAVSVTAITYHFLKNQETSNFEIAVSVVKIAYFLEHTCAPNRNYDFLLS